MEIYYIYGIECRPENKWYIGQTKDIVARLKAHYKSAEDGFATSCRFAHDWKKYGRDGFYTHILASTTIDDIDSLEINYIKHYKNSYNRRYEHRGEY